MKISSFVIVLSALIGGSLAANATSYRHHHHPRCKEFSDVDQIGTKLVAWDTDTSNDSYSGSFNILEAGYDPDAYELATAKVWFQFKDDGDRKLEWVEIDLGRGATGWGPFEVDSGWEGGSIFGSAKFQLSSTGVLDYTVGITKGDVYLKKAKLKACANHKKPTKVSDGGVTGTLLGANLLGLALLRRKFGKR